MNKVKLDVYDYIFYYFKSMLAHIVATVICGVVIPSSESTTWQLLAATTAVYLIVYLLIMFLFLIKDIPNHYKKDCGSKTVILYSLLYALPGEGVKVFLSCVPILGSLLFATSVLNITPAFGLWLMIYPDVIANQHTGDPSQIFTRLLCYLLIHLIFVSVMLICTSVMYCFIWKKHDMKQKSSRRLTMDPEQMK